MFKNKCMMRDVYHSVEYRRDKGRCTNLCHVHKEVHDYDVDHVLCLHSQKSRHETVQDQSNGLWTCKHPVLTQLTYFASHM